MHKTYSSRHTYLGQPGKLAVAAYIMDMAVAAYIMDKGHSKMPQLI
jgi:hypothetical protein